MKQRKRSPALAGDRAEGTTHTEDHSTDDHAWFFSHPDRTHRLRDPLSHEVTPDFMEHHPTAYVVVRQHEPGRYSYVIHIADEYFPRFIYDEETFLHSLYDICEQTQHSSKPSMKEIFAQAEALDEVFNGRPQ